jgi:2-amino-4-hydroxy-6-hydroxymethyldihydropteridine diphosphokinase
LELQQKQFTLEQSKCLIAFGSNGSEDIGASTKVVNEALRALSKRGLTKIKTSPFYKTPAFPVGSGPDFVNGVIMVKTDLSAVGVLALLHEVETEFGRTRDRRWEARILDLDLIDFASCVTPNEQVHRTWREMPLKKQKSCAPDQLILPHPRVQDRLFVLVPLRDVEPDWVHPVTGVSIQDILAGFSKAELMQICPIK